MANMGYCRFRNILAELQEGNQALNETGGNLDQLSAEEKAAAERLIRLCRRIGEEWMTD